MSFESLMKVIEEEINKIDYNSDIILTNTTTGKKLIIPKNIPKPINFFDIPYDVRDIIYNKVRDLRNLDTYELLQNLQYACVEVSFKLRRRQKKLEVINFINEDAEEEKKEEKQKEEKQNEDNKQTCEKKLDDLLNNITDNNGKLKERITERIARQKWKNKDDFILIKEFKFIYDKRKKTIDHIITKEILNNEYNLIKHNYNRCFEIYDDNRDKIYNNFSDIRIEKTDDLLNYLQIYKDEFGEDDKIKKIMNDYKIEFAEYSRIHSEYMGERTDRYKENQRKKDYNLEYKKLFCEKLRCGRGGIL